MFGKLLTNQKIAHKIVKPYVYKALREGLKTHDNGKIQNFEGSIPSLRSTLRIVYLINKYDKTCLLYVVCKLKVKPFDNDEKKGSSNH